MSPRKRAKIVATIGPASSNLEVLTTFFDSGVDVFRLNFSHGEHATHRANYDMIRSLEAKTRRPTCILADIQGPKLRLGKFKDGKIDIQPGHKITLVLEEVEGTADKVTLPHPEIFAALEPEALLLLDDGKVRLRVKKCTKTKADCVVEAGTKLSDRKGVNVPNLVLPISALTEKDRLDLDFALKLGVDWVALSFVQKPADVIEARRIVGERAHILVKMEKPSALHHLSDLVTLSDGMMVARGDLGVELPPEQVPPAQRRIISACRKAGKPVIVATQRLESMITSPVPTRAEASDVASAVYEGADAVMLSAESAAGRFPIEAVQTMARIIDKTESSPQYRSLLEGLGEGRPSGVEQNVDGSVPSQNPIAAAAKVVAEQTNARAIVTHSRSGRTVARVSRNRPNVPVVCLSPSLATARVQNLSWGVKPKHIGPLSTEAELVEKGAQVLIEFGLAQQDDEMVVTAGVPFGKAGRTNMLRLERVSDSSQS